MTITENSKTNNTANLGFRPVTASAKIDTRLYSINAGTPDFADAAVVVFDDAYPNAV